jgi:hypothetical protein
MARKKKAVKKTTRKPNTYMPKVKIPLSFDKAIDVLLKVKPERPGQSGAAK